MSDSTKVYTADQDGERLDRFLTRMEPTLSRAHVQKVIAEGQALVSGRVRKANYKLQAGEEVTFHLPEAKPVEILPEDIPLDILYEDSDIIVINKARGMVVHPATGIYTGTLVNALLYHCKDLSGINGEIRPGIVHRLDKDTSGVMVAAKNDAAHLDLAEQIRTKAAHRIYWAIVCGNIREEAGVIKGDIGRHPTDRKKMAIVHEHGKPAVTHFRVLERFGDYTLVECRLE
ncbi:RluA family pseudouridine synthase, partial [Mitsuokella multacida]